MEILEINYINFRNLIDGSVKFFPKLNLFFGKNGQGKTSLLDARDVVGVQVQAGDGLVGLEHDGDGEGHVVVGPRVGQGEDLDGGVELQCLGEAHQDFGGDAV